MKDTICLNDSYSTTKLLQKEKPILKNQDKKYPTTLFCTPNEKTIAQGGLRKRGYFKASYVDKPLLSVITVVFNGENFLEKTIQSVLSQPYDNIELLIIDGGSKDGTLEIIQKYDDQIDYWVSEPDKGIYDAMNKGIDIALGKGLFFLNAGDFFVDDVIMDTLQIPSYLPVKSINSRGKLVDMKITDIKLGLPICHQGIVFEKKDIHYDVRYRMSADYDYYLNHGYKYLDFSQTDGYVFYDTTGVSSTNIKARLYDVGKIIYKHFGVIAMVNYAVRAMAINTLLIIYRMVIKRPK